MKRKTNTQKAQNTPQSRRIKRLPSVEELARLAAASPKAPPTEAVQRALDLWCAAESLLALEEQNSVERALADVPMPSIFPATFSDFLRIVVRGKTPDATKRFRDYYRTTLASFSGLPTEGAQKYSAEVASPDPYLNRKTGEIDRDRWAADALAAVSVRGIPTLREWVDLARAYRDWWQGELSRKNRESASARNKNIPKVNPSEHGEVP